MKITWNQKDCCHSGNCVRSLPKVFTVETDGLVIRPENAPEDRVREIVAACPAKALIIESD
jgi:uncharacterized Fe-S cluster protein YjdI